MNLTIDAIEAHARGKVYTVTADGRAVSILLTSHALGRIAQWRLAVERVIEALLWPEEVLRYDTSREGGDMRIAYSPDADTLMIQLREGEPVDSRDMDEGVIIHLSADGQPLEIEILDASKIIQKKDIEISMEALFCPT
jgi:uncharacterized protein YuzE